MSFLNNNLKPTVVCMRKTYLAKNGFNNIQDWINADPINHVYVDRKHAPVEKSIYVMKKIMSISFDENLANYKREMRKNPIAISHLVGKKLGVLNMDRGKTHVYALIELVEEYIKENNLTKKDIKKRNVNPEGETTVITKKDVKKIQREEAKKVIKIVSEQNKGFLSTNNPSFMKMFAKKYKNSIQNNIVDQSNFCADCNIDEKKNIDLDDKADDECTCGRRLKKDFKLFAWQELSKQYSAYFNTLNYEKAKARGFIKYWGLGTGKTISGLTDALMMRPYKSGKEYKLRDIVILIPASLRKPTWIPALLSWAGPIDMQNENYDVDKIDDVILKRHGIYIIHHNAHGTLSKRLNEIEGGLNNKVILIDEVHNILANLATINNTNSKKGSMTLYKKLMTAKNHKIIALSGTIMINSPYEIAYLINILRGREIFPIVEDGVDLFSKTFYDRNLDLVREEIFYKLLNGLVSYYGSDRSNMPEKITEKIVAVEMSQRQSLVHIALEEMDEEKIREKQLAGRRGEQLTTISDVNKRLRRAAALNATGALRSALGFYDATSDAKNEDGDELSNFKVSQRQNSNFVLPKSVVNKYKDKLNDKQKKVGMIPAQDTDRVKMDIRDVIRESKMDLRKNLDQFSPKFTAILTNMKKVRYRKCVVYSNYKNYGIYPFSMILEQAGFKQYKGEKIDLDNWNPALRYAIISGDNKSVIKQVLDAFNDSMNLNGQYIQILLLTGSAKEGISLKAVRQMHIMEPHWNRQLTEQVEGRAVRLNSHMELKPNLRKVHIFKYMSFLRTKKDSNPSITKLSIDYFIGSIAARKTNVLKQIKNVMRDISYDCIINRSRMDAREKKDDIMSCYEFDDEQTSFKLEEYRQEYDCRGKDYQKEVFKYESNEYFRVGNGIYEKKDERRMGNRLGTVRGDRVIFFDK